MVNVNLSFGDSYKEKLVKAMEYTMSDEYAHEQEKLFSKEELAYIRFQELGCEYDVVIGDVFSHNVDDRSKKMEVKEAIKVACETLTKPNNEHGLILICQPAQIFLAIIHFELLSFTELIVFCQLYWEWEDIIKSLFNEKYPHEKDILNFIQRSGGECKDAVEFYKVYISNF